MKAPTSRPLRTALAAAASFAVALSALAAPSAAHAETGEPYVFLDEDFSAGVVPGGWNAESGTWDVVDGRLRGSTPTATTVRMQLPTPTVPFTEYRLEATVRFESVINSLRFIHLVFEGNAVAVRSQTSSASGLEYYGAAGSQTFPAPFDVGIGADFHSVIEVRGSDMTWTIDGTEVLAVDDYAPRDARWGVNVNGATVTFDDISLVDLNPEALASEAPVFPRLTESGSSTTLSWDAPGFPGSHTDGSLAEITRYEVSAAGASAAVDDVTWVTASGTSHTFAELPTDEQQVLRVRALNSADLTGPAAEARTIAGADAVGGYLRSFEVTNPARGHVQGIAVDTDRQIAYLSFADRVVKTDRAGNILGSLVGLSGHLGDITVNQANGKLYGAYYWKDSAQVTQFAVAIIDPDLMDGLDAPAQDNPAFTVAPVYTVDGLAFGPTFGTADGEWLLTVSLNHPHNLAYQYFAQYDVSDLEALAVRYNEGDVAPTGGPEPEGFYSVHTGPVSYNVLQNLAYDPDLERWFLGVYAGTEAEYPNYTMFAVDAEATPTLETFIGTEDQGLVVPLADDGQEHEATGIRGWFQKADNGIQPLGDGLYYLAGTVTEGNLRVSTLTLYAWSGNPGEPFIAPSAPEDGINLEAVVAERPAGTLSLTVAEHGGVVTLKEQAAPDRLRFTGEMPAVTVSDSRNDELAAGGGWAVSGRAGSFVAAGDAVSASALGWSPSIVEPRAGVTAAAPVLTAMDGGAGLATPAGLVSADASGRFGEVSLGAGLTLDLPTDTVVGTYRGALTLSLFPVD